LWAPLWSLGTLSGSRRILAQSEAISKAIHDFSKASFHALRRNTVEYDSEAAAAYCGAIVAMVQVFALELEDEVALCLGQIQALLERSVEAGSYIHHDHGPRSAEATSDKWNFPTLAFVPVTHV
jgi:hypothetical protein